MLCVRALRRDNDDDVQLVPGVSEVSEASHTETHRQDFNHRLQNENGDENIPVRNKRDRENTRIYC